ncbi:toxin-antitoxin system, toxin component [Streptomyces platensis subsp. clarensis]|uniref:Toxin-antitoxin system, toxin component n=1 Tax=Streptomyces showdoensis TaxID=68268 RepID=A0A2P2GR18_STREW|nr:DUF397 domain-containing protein [Streptomyces showdoensis]KKZ73944.1 toxin-antitoxin system, toxin component [Streptomyces showdoensis]MCW7991501.1 toxin-antitoxin system, toxin component [Streptomyces platensis subsp. clarensis]
MNDPQWFKSSHSNNDGNCVEVAGNLVPTLGVVPVRDSKTPAGSALAVSAPAFAAFIEGIKGDQLGA